MCYLPRPPPRPPPPPPRIEKPPPPRPENPPPPELNERKEPPPPEEPKDRKELPPPPPEELKERKEPKFPPPDDRKVLNPPPSLPRKTLSPLKAFPTSTPRLGDPNLSPSAPRLPKDSEDLRVVLRKSSAPRLVRSPVPLPLRLIDRPSRRSEERRPLDGAVLPDSPDESSVPLPSPDPCPLKPRIPSPERPPLPLAKPLRASRAAVRVASRKATAGRTRVVRPSTESTW
jgi:hypothetical protein